MQDFSPDPISIELNGQDIRALRQSLGLSMERFARVVDVATTTIFLWEKDEQKPNLSGQKKLANVIKQINQYKKNQEKTRNNNVYSQ